MTRYSRSVIPGRATGGDENLDRMVFGAKKRPVAPPANDGEPSYPDPMDMDVDEHGFLVDRADSDRRKSDDRRKSVERRKGDNRRKSDFPPLRESGAHFRTADEGKRGPLLLVGALVIVAVFGVVVWNAYRDGVRTDDPDVDAPQLATAGAFKTPAYDVKESPVAGSEPAEVLSQLEGGPPPVSETRAAPAPAAAKPFETTTAPSKFTAPPPEPLKQSVPATQQVATKPAEVAAAPPPAPKSTSAPIDLPKPSTQSAAVAPATAKPVVASAAPAATPVVANPQLAGFRPAFSSSGKWVAQIAAAASEAGAQAEWDRRSKAMPEFFAGAEKYIVQADVNGKTVYRLRAGPFAAKADADAFCAAFKAKGGNCFPATK